MIFLLTNYQTLRGDEVDEVDEGRNSYHQLPITNYPMPYALCPIINLPKL
ncbi:MULTISPECIES: hypothetical protein [unclassified Tolypothrix]|nr:MULTISPECIES: hypothetical protein [unclassified Tolypothrix]EKE99101.1 hypothetical protein FDUTEX481_03293 [Tolypothrix sp. PCC 7601]UYD35757.1 hypothetical protein HG267_08380 [Tolypothrix sp. PCC 7601]BAY94671.1 hypothetical protein NIES3275_67230 [Microchaete diplosiphon NIES-3275]